MSEERIIDFLVRIDPELKTLGLGKASADEFDVIFGLLSCPNTVSRLRNRISATGQVDEAASEEFVSGIFSLLEFANHAPDSQRKLMSVEPTERAVEFLHSKGTEYRFRLRDGN